MFRIPINIKRSPAEAVIRTCSVKKVLLNISQNSQEDSFKIDSKIDLKVNLMTNSRTVMFPCESCETFKNKFFVEHQQTAASAIDIDAKYSLPGQ